MLVWEEEEEGKREGGRGCCTWSRSCSQVIYLKNNGATVYQQWSHNGDVMSHFILANPRELASIYICNSYEIKKDALHYMYVANDTFYKTDSY